MNKISICTPFFLLQFQIHRVAGPGKRKKCWVCVDKEWKVNRATGPLQVIIKKEEMPDLFQVMLEESCFPLKLSVCWLNWSFMFQLKFNWVNRQFYQEQSRTRLSLITPCKKIENIIQYLYLSIAGLACSAGFELHSRIQWWMLKWKNFPGNIEKNNTVPLPTRQNKVLMYLLKWKRRLS